MTFNEELIAGLWKCRDRETDSAEQRAAIRAWLRQCIALQQKRGC